MIDIDIPIADIEMSAHGKTVGNVFYARRVYVRQITPRERPFDWAKTDRQSYNFDDGLLRQFRVRQTRDERLHPVENCWPLTDDEWAIVEKIVASGGLLTRGGQRTKFDARQIIDGIVIKIGTGMSWVELDREELQSGAYKSIYSLIKDDGRWDRIAEFLAKSRRRELQLDELPL